MIDHKTHISEEWIIPRERFNNRDYIESRCDVVDKILQGNLRSALKYLYLDQDKDGISTFSKTTKNTILDGKLLEERETIIFKYLFTRTSGSEKYVVGKPGFFAAKTSRYRCEDCSNPDVRVLCLDHIWEGDSLSGFKMLCANCHSIKSRVEDWKGDKKARDKREALKELIERLKLQTI